MFVPQTGPGSVPELPPGTLRTKAVVLPLFIAAGAFVVTVWAAVRWDQAGPGETLPPYILPLLAVSALVAITAIPIGIWSLQRSAKRVRQLLQRLGPELAAIMGHDLVGEPSGPTVAAYADLCALERELQRAVFDPTVRQTVTEWITSQKQPLEAALRRRRLLP